MIDINAVVAAGGPWQRAEIIGAQLLLQGDCRDIVPVLPKVDAVVTDPIWPKHGGLFGDVDAPGLLNAALSRVQASRVIVHLRNDQDPRFLCAVPDRWPFLQAMWLRFAAVGYLGRFMTGNDVAYAFGAWPSVAESSRILPAIGPVEPVPVPKLGHPSPRSLKHVEWLVHWWGGAAVLDPFVGSGTTLVACQRLGCQGVGIELDPGYFDIACRRVEDAARQPALFRSNPQSAPKQESLL